MTRVEWIDGTGVRRTGTVVRAGSGTIRSLVKDDRTGVQIRPRNVRTLG